MNRLCLCIVSCLLVASNCNPPGPIAAAIECEHAPELVAPVAIHCDAIGTTHTNQAVDPFHDLLYTWDAGDPGNGHWGDPAAWGADAEPFTQNFDRNRYQGGPVFAHVYENPGDYTIHAIAEDSSGNLAVATYSFTVADPDTAFAGTDTVCVSNSSVTAGTDGCPATASVLPNTTSCSAVAFDARRVLLKRGDTFTGQCFDGAEGPGVVAAFGSGAKPIISGGNNDVFRRIDSGWRLVDLDIEVGPFGTGAGAPISGTSDVLLLRVSIEGGFRGWVNSGDGVTRLAVFDSRIENADNTQGCSYNLFAVVPDRSAFVGTLIQNSDCHNFRVPHFDRLFVAFNRTGTAGGGNFRFHGPETGELITESRYAVIGYNTGPESQIQVGVSTASNDGSPDKSQPIDDFIVEGNFFPNGGAEINCGGERGTYRNNLIVKDTDEASPAFRVWLRNNQQSSNVGPCWYLHNTLYDPGSNASQMMIVHEQNDVFTSTAHAKGNLLYAPNATSAFVTDGHPSWIEASNVVITSNGACPFTSCPPGPSPADYNIASGATSVIDGGLVATDAEAVLGDLLGARRDSLADAGALEH